MARGLAELMERWRSDPRPSATIQICQVIADGCALAGPSEEDRLLALEVGKVATERYPDDVSVLLAVGRMYLSVGELAEAQTVAVSAAKQQGNDPRPFKLLGEMLLRRGDARRAMKAFERAMEGGIVDAHTRLWFDHSRTLMALQDQRGTGAVANEIQRLLPTLMQPPLPFERVAASEAPAAAPTPWTKQTMQGTGIPNPAKVKRPRQQTLLGIQAVSPRDQLPSDEGDDGDPTRALIAPELVARAGLAPIRVARTSADPSPAPRAPVVASNPTPAPAPAVKSERAAPIVAEDSTDDFAKTVVRTLDPLHLVRKGSEPPRPAAKRPSSSPAPGAAPPVNVPAVPKLPVEPMLAESLQTQSVVEHDELARTMIKPPLRGDPDPLAQTIVRPEPEDSLMRTMVKPPSARPLKLPDVSYDDELEDLSDHDTGTDVTEMQRKIREARLAVLAAARAGVTEKGDSKPPAAAPAVLQDDDSGEEPPTAVLVASTLAPVVPVTRAAAPRPAAGQMAPAPSIVSITNEAELIDDVTNDGSTAVLPIPEDLDSGDLEELDLDSDASTDDPSPRELPRAPLPPSDPPRSPFPSVVTRPDMPPIARHQFGPTQGGLVSLTADADLNDDVSEEDPLRSMAPTRRSMGPRMSVSELVDEFEYRPPISGKPVPASAAGFISAPPPPSGPLPIVPSWTPRPRARARRRMLWATMAFLVTTGLGAGGWYEWQRRRGEDVQAANALVTRAEEALRRGDAQALGEVDSLLSQVKSLDASNRAGALVRARRELIRLLDQGAPPSALEGAAQAARSAGVDEGSLGFAVVALASAAKDAGAEGAAINRCDKDSARAADGFYQLAVGAALEVHGDPRAVARYDAAAVAEPNLASIRMRAVRAALLLGAADGAKRAAAFAEGAKGRPEAAVLTALADEIAGKHSQAPVAVGDVADLPRPLRALAWVIARDPNRAAQGLSAAIDDADTVDVALFCARTAQRSGDADAARQAIDRALALAPDHSPARALSARLFLLAGDLEKARPLEASLAPEEAALVRGLLAYEGGDLAIVTASVGAAGDPAKPSAVVLAAARDRLRGAKPLTKERQASLIADLFYGDVVAADIALDLGDLKRAHEIIDKWTDPAKHPVRALRLARLLRYEDKVDAARAPVDAAAATRPALIERVLLDAEKKEDRARALGALDPKLEPERGWLEVYLRARSGVAGVAAARKALRKLKDPPDDAPLSLRVAAALAVGEMQDRGRGETIVKPLLKSWAGNPDVIRAAVGVGILPADALKKKRGK